MPSEQRIYIDFSVDQELGLSDELFQVIGFEGTEEISQPFRFEIDLVSDDPNIDLEGLIAQQASLKIYRDENERDIHGVIAEITQGEETQFDYYSYKAVLVPRLWLKQLSRQNQIYQDKSVPDIIKEELLNGEGIDAFLEDDLDFRLSETYPIKEYVVQYNETDLNFVSRLLEHEGIYYYFEHQSGRDCLVFCDDKSKLDATRDENRIPYVAASGLASFEDEAIHTFSLKQAQISRQLILKDYNYRKPHLPLQGEAETCDSAIGRICHYGDHVKDPVQASDLARVRAQMHLCTQKVAVGRSDALMFEAGKHFQQFDHYRDDYNGEYLVTRITHQAGTSLPGISATGPTEQALAYLNEFDAVPVEVEFRPQLTTPKPKLHGIMNATVDGEIDTDRAQIDEEGRYKLIMPFDISGTGDGKASRWVRKAESYGGQGTGMNFPLLKGTEVIWTCIDGDLDRPIITGVVPNPLNQAVVTAKNSTDNVIKTPSGIVMKMRDGKGTPVEQGQERTEKSQTRIQDNSLKSSSPSGHVMAGSDKTFSLIRQQQHTGTSNRAPIDLGSTVDAVQDVTAHFSSADLDAKYTEEGLTPPTLEPNTFVILDESGTAATETQDTPTDTGISNVGVLDWPTKPGDYIVQIQATFKVDEWDIISSSFSRQDKLVKKYFKFVVQGLYITTSADTTAEIGQQYKYKVATSGGTNPITYSVVSTTPAATPSISIDSSTGLITWTPDTEGTHDVVIRATDSSNPAKTAEQSFTLNVKEDVDFVSTVDKEDNDTTGKDETQKSYSVFLPEFRMNTADSPALQNSYYRIGSFYEEEAEFFGNVYYRTTNNDGNTPIKDTLSTNFHEASKGGGPGHQHKIMDVLNATRETYGITDSFESSAGLFEGSDPARFGLMEYTDGAKLMIHQNGCFDLAAGTSVTYDSLGEKDSLISVVLGEDEIVKSERFHKGLTATGQQWVTETWENVNAYSYSYGQQHNMFLGFTYDYKIAASFEATLGGSVECSLATKTEFCAGIHAEVKMAASINWSAGPEINLRSGDDISISSGNNEVKGNTVRLQYEPTVVTEAATKTTCTGYAAGVAAVASAVTAVGVGMAGSDPNKVKDASLVNQAASIPVGVAAAAVQVAGLAAWHKNYTATKALDNAPVATYPNVLVEKEKITLAAGAAKIELNYDGRIKIIGTDIIATTNPKGSTMSGSYLTLGSGGTEVFANVGKVNIESKSGPASIKGKTQTSLGLKGVNANQAGVNIG